MNLDTFVISLLFDDAQTKTSAKNIEDIVSNLTKSISKGLLSIGTVDFLRGAINGFKDLSTQLDNLAYITRGSASEIQAWGEAVKRNGGTAEGFYSSVSNLAGKIRDIQTSFGSEGQLAFARLGIQLRGSNGQLKNSIDLLGELGDKFKVLPQAWQIHIGQMLGLDIPTIRTLAEGNLLVGDLVKRMRELGLTTQNNILLGVKYRNAVYDLNLTWLAFKNQLAQAFLPVLIVIDNLFTKLVAGVNKYQGVIQGLATAITIVLIPTILRLLVALSPILIPIALIITAVVGLTLVFQDLYAGFHGGQSVIISYAKSIDWLYDSLVKIRDLYRDWADFSQRLQDKVVSGTQAIISDVSKKNIIGAITNISKSLGFDPSVANTIANIESGFNPNAKAKGSSAGGLFQLINSTAIANGLSISDKFNPIANAQAGIKNLLSTSQGLQNILGRKPQGWEIYLGEMLGLGGARKVLTADSTTSLGKLLGSEAIRTNHWQGMTAGQLKAQAQNTYNQKSVSVNVGSLNVHTPATNPTAVAQHTVNKLSQHVQLVNTYNNGRVL